MGCVAATLAGCRRARNGAPELWLFHGTFIAGKTYDPTPYDILRAQSAVPGPLARPAPSTWPAVFIAATALAVAVLLLAR